MVNKEFQTNTSDNFRSNERKTGYLFIMGIHSQYYDLVLEDQDMETSC